MVQHNDWFSVDKDKRAARVRSYSLGHILKEVLANSLDAGATRIDLTFGIAEGTRADRQGRKAFTLSCTDDGCGCSDPEILRKVGSSTSDASPDKRGRFGQGLIDVLAVCEKAEILTLIHRLEFNGDGCQVSRKRDAVNGMSLSGILRHAGDGFEKLEDYFSSVILPECVQFTFNGKTVERRAAIRTIPGIKVATVLYDPEREKLYSRARETSVRIYDRHGPEAKIYEMGIPVDLAPWELPYDIDVLQKTPLDMERCMLSEKYKASLMQQLMEPMSPEYIEHMRKKQVVPKELKNNRDFAKELTEAAKEEAAKVQYGRGRKDIGRRNPLDPDDKSKSQELEDNDVLPINLRHAPEGFKEILGDCPTVSEQHRERCQAHFGFGELPPVTPRQQLCFEIYGEIVAALLGYPTNFHRFSASIADKVCSALAVNSGSNIGLNIKAKFLWNDPLGAASLGVILHECAHEKVVGHERDFQRELERLAGKLAVWIGDNPTRWQAMKERAKNGPEND